MAESIASRASGPRAIRHDRPNIMVVCVDQMRGDALSSAGHPVVRTPHLDELAGEGTRYARAYSATPTCVPARVGLFTGQSQERHGRYGYREGVPFADAHPVTMQAVLREHGYQTQAIGKMHVFPERSRCGFDDVRLHDGFLHFSRRYGGRNLAAHDDYLAWLRRQPEVGPDADGFGDGVGPNSMVAVPWTLPERLHPTNWVAQETVDWLARRDPTVPFFCYVSFHRPHAPFNPPRWAFDQYLHGPRTEPPRGDWIDDFAEFRRDDHHQTVMGRLDPQTRHRAVAGYHGNISHLDLQINRIREALADHELLDDTVIIFTSDHGEMLGDHDMYRKSVGYEGSARVPLIVRPAPRFSPEAPRGQVRSEVTELRDIAPTVLEFAGVAAPPSMDGASLAPGAVGGEVARWRDHLHGEHVHFDQSLQWVTDGRRKFLWASAKGIEQFFDLEADPHELHNLIDDPARSDEIALWRRRLVDDLTGREEGFVADAALVPGRAVRTERSDIAALADAWPG
ncbi:arylsulfatase A-like enzyme [Naumannella cuiyingiana]|uniref:Arylsulfatase A-like enzyme n=1 Tax=Naumannella cuiyingiana TaxID=1347891 RepID=A0A7Z0ILR1_9ACTN|nr:arylsulfatase [Naumannella cuiyingiana]NYI71826.1 arylsulfatase A-like enzyme [Naumannella cuiyingiana]